ncbi:MAG: hypothetical protein ABH824_00445 [Nanoarchaeota archaeon]
MNYGEYFEEKREDGSDVQEREIENVYLEDQIADRERFSEE